VSAISSYPLVPLLVAAAAVVVGCAALVAARRLHRELAALRHELAAQRAATAAPAPAPASAAHTAPGLVPGARPAPPREEIREEIRKEIHTAVAEALAQERERELAEARAFWAAHDTGDSTDTRMFDGLALDGPGALDILGAIGSVADVPGTDGPTGNAGAAPRERAEEPGAAGDAGPQGFEVLPFLPRQGQDPVEGERPGSTVPAQGRHPSDPRFAPSPVVAGHERTVARLTELAEAGTPLSDVRPGPLGTLDLYVFTDGTTLCLTPGHRETAEVLTAALERGESPVLLGGSGVSGGYALTFTYGTESVYILADRVVASL
jgi:HAMP domain-containing protein